MAESGLKGRTALVTGASSGLGAAFARLLAERGADLIVTARRKDKLDALKEELEKKHHVAVDVVVLDLSEPGAPEKLWNETEGAGRTVDVLVNNAGGALHRYFADMAWEDVARQMQLNVLSLTELTHRFVKPMLGRGRGHVLNVSSIGAYAPSPSLATYSAGKAFVRDFTEALAFELRKTPVRVCCLCPGGTLTEFHQVAGQELPRAIRATFMSAEDCAAIGLRALFAGRRNVVSGIFNALSVYFMRFVPRRFLVWATARTMGEPRVNAAR